MAKYLMLGKYSTEAIKGIAAERTKKVTDAIEKVGGKVEAMYALLGNYDLAFIADFPNNKEALKASIAITKLTGIGFTTYPAVTVEEFDRIAG
ncbi:MAG: GYD domain-containing protein [Candidatus Omnitrophica bacterium]|nr:GYD domain-containing protein [Candidatus Omnitrophota bacterium]